MRHQYRDYLRSYSVRGVHTEHPQSEGDGLFCNEMTDEALFAEDISRGHTQATIRQHDAYMDRHYPSHWARRTGMLIRPGEPGFVFVRTGVNHDR